MKASFENLKTSAAVLLSLAFILPTIINAFHFHDFDETPTYLDKHDVHHYKNDEDCGLCDIYFPSNELLNTANSEFSAFFFSCPNIQVDLTLFYQSTLNHKSSRAPPQSI